MSYSILALDLATVTGWAVFKSGMQRPHFGAQRLPGEALEVGRPVEALRRMISDLHAVHGFTDIVFEAQHIAEKTNIDTVYRLIALGGMTEWIAHRVGARCFKVHIQTWRKHFLGKGTGFSRDEAKDMAIARAEEYGVITDVADAAEAFGILDYYCALIERNDRSFTTPWRDKRLFKKPGLL